jgi:sugar/nucleoside kinase (ribokinase family)
VAPLDVLCIGNALVDVLASVDDDQLAALGLAKSSWGLVDADEAHRLYDLMPPAVEVSGGSAANTAIGVVSVGGSAAYIGKVRADQLGEVFTHDLRSTGVRFDTKAAQSGSPTGRCLILVTPDAQRTMRPYLGAANELTADDVDEELVADAQVTYLEGFLWDPPSAKDAFRKAMAAARAAGRKASLSLSDVVCVNNWRPEFLDLLERGQIDVLFANEAELCALYPDLDFDAAVERLRGVCPLAAITRGALGSLVVAGIETHEVPASHVDHVVDTTGAGDLFAAGFLFGLTHGESLARCGELGSLCAAEVISHVGGRPQRPLAELVASS